MLIIVSLPSGCARTRPAITSLWQQVPPVRWPGKETNPDRGSADNLAEPAVAANVALQQDSTSQSESTSEVLARGEWRSLSDHAGLLGDFRVGVPAVEPG